MSKSLFMTRVLLLGMTYSLAACSVVASDVDDLQKTEIGDYQSLTLELRSMGIHRNEVFEYRVINDKVGGADDSLLLRGVRTPLGDSDENILLAGAIPRDKTTRLDFYADHNDEPGYQAASDIGVDHGWSMPISEEEPNPADGVLVTRDEFSGDWSLLFEHQFEFTLLSELATGRSDFRIVLSNIDAIGGAPLTVRLSFNGRAIASHRCLPEHPLVQALVVDQNSTLQLTLEIPDVVDTTVDEQAYVVDVYVDNNKNGQYDDPSAAGGDLGWRLTDLPLTPDGDVGMVVAHDLSSDASNVDVGP